MDGAAPLPPRVAEQRLVRGASLAVAAEQHQGPGETLFGRVEELVDQILFDARSNEIVNSGARAESSVNL